MDIYGRIRTRREELNMSQEELASKVGYTSKTRRSIIAKIEAGQTDISQSQVALFAAALSVTPTWLMGWNKDTPRKEIETTIEAAVKEKLKQLDTAGQQDVLEYIQYKVSKSKRKEPQKE